MEQLDPLSVVLQECISVSSAMRRATRWNNTGGVAAIFRSQLYSGSDVWGSGDGESTSNVFGLKNNHDRQITHSKLKEDNPLLGGVVQLRSMLTNNSSIRDIDSLTILQPFLMIIRTSSTSGYVTSLALDAVAKFVSYRVIDGDSIGIKQSLPQVISSLTHCRFEAGDSSSDDAVLLKVLRLLEAIIESPISDVLADEVIYEVCQTCLSLACNKRRSEVLRKAAEMAMISITIKLFSQLKHISSDSTAETRPFDEMHSLQDDVIGGTENQEEVLSESVAKNHKEVTPYGLHAIKEYLSVLISMISPVNRFQHMESTRVFAMSLITAAVEVGGENIAKHPSVMFLVADPVCKNLLQILQSVDSSPLLQESVHLFTTLVLSLGRYLQVQIEMILGVVCLIIVPDLQEEELAKNFEKLMSGETYSLAVSSKPVARPALSKELLTESLGALWTRCPSFFVKLYQIYDCTFERNDVCSKLIKCLCRLSLPDSATASNDNVPPICLEGVLSLVNGLQERIRSLDSFEIPAIEGKGRKSGYTRCVSLFNSSYKDGLAQFQKDGFITDVSDDRSVAVFLYGNCDKLNKRVIGEVLSKPAKAALLTEFMSQFQFEGLRVDEALRLILCTFRLPGESQQIERIVECFGDFYVAQNGSHAKTQSVVVPDKDAVFVLSYSIIMLNTDLHNPRVKEPMTLDDYKRNLRGVYGGKDFPDWYLEKIYDSILHQEIVLPEEHTGTERWFEAMWGKLISEHEWAVARDEPNLENLFLTTSSPKHLAPYDKCMFQELWQCVLGTLITVFEEAADDQIITKMMATIDKCINIAVAFNLQDVVSRIIETLSHRTCLTGTKKSGLLLELESSLGNGQEREILPTTRIVSETTLTVSEMGVWFGRDFKAQLCVVVLFRLLKKFKWHVSAQWVYVIKIVSNLFKSSLINPDLFPEFQKTLHLDPLPLAPAQFTLNRNASLKDSGLFSTFSSYLKGFSDEPAEPTDEEVESTLSAIDCIKSSNFYPMFSAIGSTSPENVSAFIEMVIEYAKGASEPETLFFMEMCVCLVLFSSTSAGTLLAFLDSLCKENTQSGYFIRLHVYKLVLLRSCPSQDLLNSSITQLSKADKSLLIRFAPCLLQPLRLLVNENSQIVSNPGFWSIARTWAASPKFTDDVFQMAEQVVKSAPGCITPENYMSLLGLLDEISAVGAVGSQWEQEYDQLTATGHKVEKGKNSFADIIAISVKSINLTVSLADCLTESRFDKSESWYPLIQAMAHQCFNPCREIRSHAIKHLQLLLLRLPPNISPEGVFNFGLFPLVSELSKRDVVAMDPSGIIKSQVAVVSLVCKTFTSYNEKFTDGTTILSKIVSQVSQLIGQNDNKHYFQDQSLELLKNALLVSRQSVDVEKVAQTECVDAVREMLNVVKADENVVKADENEVTTNKNEVTTDKNGVTTDKNKGVKEEP